MNIELTNEKTGPIELSTLIPAGFTQDLLDHSLAFSIDEKKLPGLVPVITR